MFVGGSLAGTDCIQALNRYRPKVDWHVWVGANPIGGYRPTSADRIQRNKLQENDLCGFLLKIIVGSGEKTVEDAFAWQAWAAIQARRNESLNNLRGDVRYLIEGQGHSLMALGEEIDGETKAELKAARSLNQQARSQGICNAETISATEARRLESKERPTLEDYYKLERYRIETSWGKAIDPELIERDQGGRTIRQITLLEALLEAPSEVTTLNGKRIHFPPALVAAKDQAEREKFHALDWRNGSVAWSLRRELGLHLFLQLEREFRNDDLDLLELQRQSQRHALIIKDFLGITVRRNATPIQILQQLLEQIGLQLLCDCREGARGDQVRVYRFDSEVWAIAQEVLEYRQSKREAKAQQGFEPSVDSVVTGVPFAEYINKGGDVTTEVELLSEELVDGLDILTQAVEFQEEELVRSLWMAWDLPQRSAVLMQMSNEVRSRVMETLGLLPGAIVRWIGKAEAWLVEAVEGLQVKVRQEPGLGQDWRVAFAELDPIDLG